jgi:hypothetical protein
MLIDHAYLLESHFAHELPEALIGAIRCVVWLLVMHVCDAMIYSLPVCTRRARFSHCTLVILT